MDDRVRLYVPYSDKEYAKELGCKWDSDQRCWYCFKSNTNLSICINNWGERRESITEERVYLKVPQADKDNARQLNCLWDHELKSWYCLKSNGNISICTQKWGSMSHANYNQHDAVSSTIKSCKIPEIILYSFEQVKQRTHQDKLAYEESIKNYMNKFISVNGTSSQPMVDTQQPRAKQVVDQAPLIYWTRADMEHDEKVSGASFKRKYIILDEQ